MTIGHLYPLRNTPVAGRPIVANTFLSVKV